MTQLLIILSDFTSNLIPLLSVSVWYVERCQDVNIVPSLVLKVIRNRNLPPNILLKWVWTQWSAGTGWLRAESARSMEGTRYLNIVLLLYSELIHQVTHHNLGSQKLMTFFMVTQPSLLTFILMEIGPIIHYVWQHDSKGKVWLLGKENMPVIFTTAAWRATVVIGKHLCLRQRVRERERYI